MFQARERREPRSPEERGEERKRGDGGEERRREGREKKKEEKEETGSGDLVLIATPDRLRNTGITCWYSTRERVSTILETLTLARSGLVFLFFFFFFHGSACSAFLSFFFSFFRSILPRKNSLGGG